MLSDERLGCLFCVGELSRSFIMRSDLVEGVENNVVSIFARKNKTEEEKTGESKPISESFTFEEIMARNAQNSDRLRKERNKANKNVIRSHRLKR